LKVHFHLHSTFLANKYPWMLIRQITNLSLRPIRRTCAPCAFPNVTVCGACGYNSPWNRQRVCKTSQSPQQWLPYIVSRIKHKPLSTAWRH
jgi:hypothetical protein